MEKTEILSEIQKALKNYVGKWNEKKGVWEFSTIIAERKTFLAKKKLTYTCKIKIDDRAQVVKFSEMLCETGSGMTSGGGFDDGVSTGFGFKKESYNTFSGSRQGAIEEQSTLFAKEYSYAFDYKEVRIKVKNIVDNVGYKFEVQILPVK